MCAKHYENPTMLSRVTAKNVGDVFLRHTVEIRSVERGICPVYNERTVPMAGCIVHARNGLFPLSV